MKRFFPWNHPGIPRIAHSIERWWQLAVIAFQLQPQPCSPEQKLAELGLDKENIQKLLLLKPSPLKSSPLKSLLLKSLLLKSSLLKSLLLKSLLLKSKESEPVLAQWDQDNHILLCHEVDLPFLEGSRIDKDGFVPRERNHLDLVLYHGQPAIRKKYAQFGCFCNEALALHRLALLVETPNLLGLNIWRKILYQTPLPGRNLGTLMATKGVSILLQHELNGIADYGLNNVSQEWQAKRQTALQVLNQCVDQAFLEALKRLVVAIHQAGVILRDVKYGNVLIQNGQPQFCDFDAALLLPKNAKRFNEERCMDWQRLDFLFNVANQ